MQDLALYEGDLGAEAILEHYERGENTYRVANTTPPSIEGSARDGQTLTAGTGTWSGGTPISYAYQWQSCNDAGGQCEDIEGATGRSYELSSADLETKLRVRVTATNAGGSAASTSAASSLIESGAPDELEAPSIVGGPNVGETLHADSGDWGGTGTELGYQWERCNSTGGECADISGATGSDLELGESDVGATLRLRVGASNELGSLTAVSQPTEPVAAASLLVNTWAPGIVGVEQSGQTLTAQTGSWLGEAAISYSYQWLSCKPDGSDCEEITGATGSSYTLGGGNVGDALRARVIATESGGTASVTSTPTQPVAGAGGPEIEAPPSVSGTGLVGYKLTASNGVWSSEEALSYNYQWVRCGEDGSDCSSISGAASDSYTLKESDAASAVRVVVTATNASSHASEAISAPIGVSAGTLVDMAAPSISGSYQEGQALNADAGIWTGSGAIGYAYQWKRCNEAGESCSPLSGVTESTYTPVAGDVGHTLKVEVTGSGTAGTDSVFSPATPVIGAEPFAPIEIEEPTLEGYGTVGDTLTAQHGLWVGTETITYGYEWQKCNADGEECEAIAGATGGTYVLAESQIGDTVRVVVTATNTAGNESATSVQSEVVAAAAAPEVTESPAIQGDPRAGVQAHIDNGVWTGSQPLRDYYLWQRCNAGGESCTAIEGATKPSYTPESGDVGSTLRVMVTVSNSHGSVVATTAAVSVASATEASIGRALEAAEATDPSVLAPATSATLEEQTVKPAIGETGEDISSSAALTSSTISKETPGEFAVNAANGPLSFTPLDPPSNATTTPTIVNETAAAFAETSHDTDTFVRPSPLGETAILQLRGAEAATSFTWEVGIGSDQELEELPNGDIAVIEPSSLPSLEAELPSEALESPESETGEEPGGEGESGAAAESELESSLEEEGMLEPLPAAPTTTTALVASKSGELHPQETGAEYDSAESAMAYAEEHTAHATVMVIRAPSVLDASGVAVSAALKVEGDAMTMNVSPSESTKYPITAAVSVNAPSDKASAAKTTEARYGLSDPNAKPFAREEGGKLVDNLDPHLTSKPLEVKNARLVLYYGTSPDNQRLHEWLKAVKKAKLTPFITLGRCEPVPPSFTSSIEGSCPKNLVPTLEQYRKSVKRLMHALIKGRSDEPPVRLWGAWNEPDINRTSLHANPAKAAHLWGEAQLAAEEAGCDHLCVVVAGEFHEDGGVHDYIAKYQNVIRMGERKHSFPVKVHPHIWGMHDYNDLINVRITDEKGKETLGSYVNKEARGFANSTRARFLGAHVWLTEQGVLLQYEGKTRLDGNLELQRLAAQDFLRLGRSSQHFERAYYYLYEGPSEERLEEKKGEFDSALLHGEGVHEGREPREAYCVLALGDNSGCPAKSITKAVVSGSTTASASTVLLNVYPEGLPTKYVVEYGTTMAYGLSTTSAETSSEVGAQSETVSLSGLEPCTTYHYQAEAENEANEDAPSLGGDKMFRTGGCVATAVSVGGAFACAVVSDGSAQCWGDNSFGELGDGKTVNSSVPVPVGGLTGVTAISAGLEHSCALIDTGDVYCWGDNESGELGNGTTVNSSTPVEVDGVSDAIAVSAGGDVSCALISTGKIECWGWNYWGQLGDGTTSQKSTPASVSGIAGAIQVSTNGFTSCAVLSSGDVECWGENSGDAFGYQAPYGEWGSDVPVTLSDVTAPLSIAPGAEHICALFESGDIECWGSTTIGLLNNGVYTSERWDPSPSPVGGISKAISLSGAGWVDCALLSNEDIKCWGDDEFGQLGDGEITAFEGEGSLTGVTVSGIDDAKAVSVGEVSGCALLAGGGIDCWGDGEDGLLGDGNEETRAVPAPVVGFG